MPDFIILAFIFVLGACVGSFLNVVVYRVPRGIPLGMTRSMCPSCQHQLAWYDNIPVLAWLLLGGKCRYCKKPISPRYPTIEFITGALFVFYYVMFFDLQFGPCRAGALRLNIQAHWPIYFLYMFMIASLLAASLIDAELFIIPLEICWLMAAVGVIVHAIVDTPNLPGNVIIPPAAAALAAGGTIGWLVSLLFMRWKVLKRSFPQGEPLLEVDRAAALTEIEQARREGRTLEYESNVPPQYTGAQIRGEIGNEMLFMLPAMLLGGAFALLVIKVPAVDSIWTKIIAQSWVGGALGALLGALVGAFIVWITRILGTLGFGRVAMGLGDVHLMFGVGAIIGAGPVTVAFFLAPFGGMLLALYLLIFGKHREIPYGPYLSLGTAATLLFYCPIAAWLAPGLSGLGQMFRSALGG